MHACVRAYYTEFNMCMVYMKKHSTMINVDLILRAL